MHVHLRRALACATAVRWEGALFHSAVGPSAPASDTTATSNLNISGLEDYTGQSCVMPWTTIPHKCAMQHFIIVSTHIINLVVSIIIGIMSTVVSINSINVNMTLTIITIDIGITNMVTIIVTTSTVVTTYITISGVIDVIATITVTIIDISNNTVLNIVIINTTSKTRTIKKTPT